jgi:phage terminase small subunit
MCLNEKQIRFCQEYIIDLNASAAAIRSGYSEKTAGIIGFENLRKPKIAEKIAELIKNRSMEVKIEAEDVLKRLKTVLEADVIDICTMNKDQLKDLPPEVRQMVVGYKETPTEHGSIVELKFFDKHKALEMINRHIGFYETDNKQKNERPIILKGGQDLPDE